MESPNLQLRVRNLDLPDNLDRPAIVGELHFPAWDCRFAADNERGRLSQAQRADSYWYYLASDSAEQTNVIAQFPKQTATIQK